MFDKILEKAEEAMTQLSKTLSVFEQEYSRLKLKFEEQIAEYHRRVDDDLHKMRTMTNDETLGQRKDFEGILFQQKLELNKLLDEHREKSKEIVDKGLQDFTKAVHNRFESIYAEYEVEAVKKAEANFETDMESLFKRYGDKIAPHIFKSLLRYIFRFGRK